MEEFSNFTKNLDALGEEEVRRKLSQGVWANRRKTWAQDWLNNLESSRTNDRTEKDLALSAEANDIARSTLGVAQHARTISIVAIIVSALVAIAVAILQLVGQKPS